jgi:hypothetical protein
MFFAHAKRQGSGTTRGLFFTCNPNFVTLQRLKRTLSWPVQHAVGNLWSPQGARESRGDRMGIEDQQEFEAVLVEQRHGNTRGQRHQEEPAQRPIQRRAGLPIESS